MAGLDVSPEEQSHQRWKERRPLVKLLKESHQEAFKKDSDLIQNIRQAYFQMHCADHNHKGSQDLPHTFQGMAISVGLMDSEVHKVQEVWTGQKGLQVAYCKVKGSPKGIQFFWEVPPTKLPKIMGLKAIHSPEALHCQVGLSFCPQCRKEGKNEGMIVNHL